MEQIKMLSKELFNRQVSYNIELEINNKVVEIAVYEAFKTNGGYIDIDWDILNDVELDDGDFDLIDDWVNAYKYEKEEDNKEVEGVEEDGSKLNIKER